MKKTRKFLVGLLSILTACCSAFAFSACAEKGEKGEKGETGAGIQSVEVDENGKLIITLTDGTTLPAIELPTISSTESASDLQYQQIAGKDEYCVMGIGLAAGNDIVIPSTYNGKPVTEIGESAFANTYITSIKIPDSVTVIGDFAFDECDNLTSIEIPNGVTSIGEDAFGNCLNLTSIEIPNSVTSIGDFAFSYCSNLTSVEIPNSVTSIGYGAFSGCSNLTSVVINGSLTSNGGYTFGGCASLTSVVIDDSLISIEGYMFKDCDNLTSVYYKGTVEDWDSININDDGNDDLTSATRYYYIENEGDVPQDNGKYWHYVDGVPTPWGT